MMKTYNKLFLLTTGFMLLLCAAIALWVQPISNDLTRIGAYPERWFGWNTPQHAPPPLIESAPASGKRKILVVGDSFSKGGYWQPYLNDKYSFSYVYIRHVGFDGLLHKIAVDKPDAVVVQSIERDLFDIFGSSRKLGRDSADCSFPSVVATDRAVISPEQLTKAVQHLPVFPETSRPLQPSSLNSLSEGFYYLKSWLKILAKPKERNTNVLALNEPRLFSNTRNDRLLVLSEDALLQDDWPLEQVKTIRCGMQKVSDALLASGLPYVILAVPDKTTAYQPYLANSALRDKPALIDQVQVDHLPHGINMLPVLRSKLEGGQIDLYLPSDTHWGYAGYQVAAVLIDHELTSQWYHP